jgi:hypothetical protein
VEGRRAGTTGSEDHRGSLRLVDRSEVSHAGVAIIADDDPPAVAGRRPDLLAAAIGAWLTARMPDPPQPGRVDRALNRRVASAHSPSSMALTHGFAGSAGTCPALPAVG